MYLIDWYDQEQCHINDPEIPDRGNGRVYKVSYGNSAATRVDMRAASDDELIGSLLRENDWHVRHARRVLQERAAAGQDDCHPGDPEAPAYAAGLQPGARRAGVEGFERLSDGSQVLKVKVTAPPEDGKANDALVALLAKTWKLAKRDLELVSGHKNRNKTLLLHGQGEALGRQLEELYGSPT